MNVTLDSIDITAVNAYKDGIIAGKFKGLQGLIKSKGITVIEGEGKLQGTDTVVVNGRVVKYDGRRIGMPLAPVRDKVAASVEYVRGELGEAAWDEWMHPQIPEDETIPNPYTYQDEDD